MFDAREVLIPGSIYDRSKYFVEIFIEKKCLFLYGSNTILVSVCAILYEKGVNTFQKVSARAVITGSLQSNFLCNWSVL